jgi:hypothetical protein
VLPPVSVRLGNGRDATGNQPQSRVLAELFGTIEHHLHAEADPEERPVAFRKSSQRFDKIAATQLFHSIAECTHSRKDQTICSLDRPRIRGDLDDGVLTLEGPTDAEQIADAVIDDRNLHG